MNEKLENLLNLALDTPEGLREESNSLNAGFDADNQTWELIVKYNGSLDRLSAMNITVEPLIAGYAILTVPQASVSTVAAFPEIEYAEIPKQYYYSQMQDFLQSVPADSVDYLSAACIHPLTGREPYLTGRGTLIAVLDSGIDYRLPIFQTPDGFTRIRTLWDQTQTGGRPPAGFTTGREYDASQINRALRENTAPLTIDLNGHGTAVAGIAATVSPDAEFVIIKLGQPGTDGSYSLTTDIMRGVTYALRLAQENNTPLVINLSFGNSYGSHDGSSLLERFLNNASEIGRTFLCVGSGNEAASPGHTSGRALSETTINLAVAQYQSNLSIQLFTDFKDTFRVRLRSPGGESAALTNGTVGLPSARTFQLESTLLLCYLGEPTPYSTTRELYLDMQPTEGEPYITSGLWQLQLIPVDVTTGLYRLYLPDSSVRNTGTGFSTPNPQATFTIPSTAARVLTVGAYDSRYDSYADFSGRGYPVTAPSAPSAGGRIKPDLVAPGVNIPAPDIFGGYNLFTGTSFATPIASGCSALLMEWGIVRVNDPFLYGEKLKAYLQRGAQPLRGELQYPNNRVGWGKLCGARSLPDVGLASLVF